MEISYDGVSLMNSPYVLSSWDLESVKNKDVLLLDLARQRGGQILMTQLQPKKFTVRGKITGDTQEELEQHIDEFKELMDRSGKNLDYSYAGGTRRLIATAVVTDPPRNAYNVTFVDFSVSFIAPEGVAFDVAETEVNLSAISDLIKTDTLTILGTTSPEVRLELTFTAESGITSLDFLANGSKITLTEAFTNGDVVIFNAKTLKVTLNGVEKEYTGIFPEFYPGANVYQIEAHGTSLTYNAKLIYTKTYL